jgi:hypothetical protein
MPWTEKQLRLFRAAAHNPEIAKRTGIKQSDAERMSKEGLKKMAGGGEAKQKILRQDTRHGKVDMPFAKLGRFSGMKKGGLMKKRRFNGEEESYVDDSVEPEVERKYFATGVSAKDSAPTPAKKPAKSISDDGSYDRKEMRPRVGKSVSDDGSYDRKEMRPRPKATPTPVSSKSFAEKPKYGYTEEERAANRQRVIDAAKSAGEGVSSYLKNIFSYEGRKKMREERDKTRGFRKGGSIMRPKKDIGKDQMGMAPYRKGGEMESKAMVKKEIGFMKKKGAPASMIKHEKAEMRGMKKGGSIRAHGEHGVQKSGHTRGTVVKMAKGGFVRSADGVAQRGKTKGKMC